jgi:hypothetical protein
MIAGIFIFLGGKEFCFADGPDVEAEPQKEEFNWREAIDQVASIEIDVGFSPLSYYGDRDMSLESASEGSTIGLSAGIDITSFLGIGFYSKYFDPSRISFESKETLYRNDGFSINHDIYLLDMLFGPVFTVPGNRATVQLKLALGYHILLLHVNLSDASYGQYNTKDYYRKYTGIGGNLTIQVYLSYKWYMYARLQYAYGRHSDYATMQVFAPSLGLGISLPNLFKTFPEKEKKPEKEKAAPSGERSG